MDPVLILFSAGAMIATSILMVILVFCGCRYAILKWFGWLLIVVAIAWIYACYFPIGHFSTPEPSAVFEPIIPLGAGIITVYLLRRPRKRTEHGEGPPSSNLNSTRQP
jgi:hypothetical protein